MKWVKWTLLVAGCCIVLLSMMGSVPSDYTKASVTQFSAAAKDFTISTNNLKVAVTAINKGDKASIAAAKKALVQCRLQYKRIEFFMEYFFEYPVNLYNRAPVFEVEEPYMEYQAPIGLQVVEGFLFDENVYSHKKELVDQCQVIATTANDIPALFYDLKVNDGQLLESIRLELVRIISLGITGYDAPQLKTGIPEAAAALSAVNDNFAPLLRTYKGQEADSVHYYLELAIRLLDAHPEFNGFDRLAFLTAAALPLQQHLSSFINEHNLDLNTHDALDHQAAHLFSKNALNLVSFRKQKEGYDDKALAALGKQLFFEKALSGNGKRSCATCHQPEKFFTDGLAKSRDLDEHSDVARNAPTLYYAAYQRAQFYDGRAGSLEDQIKAVLQNPHEMDAKLSDVVAYLNKNPSYKAAFNRAYRNDGSNITTEHLAGALAAFEQTLSPFNSPFDRYIGGEFTAMDAAQKRGFNLFMGKAQCGTCHFAPLFNGLLPPYYERSESEVLGVPQRGGKHPVSDKDSGRYGFFAISFNKGAFKTSTVRNAAATAPYMHNGVFKTLDEVVDFYNDGGGKGLKLEVDNQTLSDKPLGLTKKEKQDVVAFLRALTDSVSAHYISVNKTSPAR